MTWDSQVGEENVWLGQSVQLRLESGVPQGRLMVESELLSD